MTDAEKAVAFDLISAALVNQWHDGRWTWWCPTPCGELEPRATKGEAVADLVAWAGKMAGVNRKREAARCGS